MELKRVMLFHQIITSKGTRLLKEVIDDQIRSTYPGCWTEQTLEICKKYNLGVQLIKCMKKRKPKQLLKERIRKRLERRLEVEKREKTKTRLCGGFVRKKYITNGSMSKNIVRGILKTRLNMLELNCNYKGNNRSETCGLCKEGKDTTEHLFECREIRRCLDDVPDIEVLKTDSDEAYSELGKFVKNVCDLRGINPTKTVKENLDHLQKKLDERKTYIITSYDPTDLKTVIKKVERKNYQISSFNETDLRMTISCS